MLEEPRRLIEAAIRQYEISASEAEATLSPDAVSSSRSVEALDLAVTELLMAGKYEELERVARSLGDTMPPTVRDSLAWSHIVQGNVLFDQARKKAGEQADALFGEAYEKYAQALAIEADKHEALYNWGLALSVQARTKAGEQADALFGEAYEKYAQALAINPDLHQALYKWGLALSEQAKTKAGEQADALFGEAYEKYAQGLAIEPDDHEALYDWGTALLDEAKTKAGAEADALFERARTKLLQAELLKEGAGAYNLACVAALRAREEECREWLNVDKRCGTLPDRRHLESDTDLDGVRDEPWFREFLAGL